MGHWFSDVKPMQVPTVDARAVRREGEDVHGALARVGALSFCCYEHSTKLVGDDLSTLIYMDI